VGGDRRKLDQQRPGARIDGLAFLGFDLLVFLLVGGGRDAWRRFGAFEIGPGKPADAKGGDGHCRQHGHLNEDRGTIGGGGFFNGCHGGLASRNQKGSTWSSTCWP